MSKERMTIHRALSELKLMDAKIKKGVEDLQPVGGATKEGKINQLYTREEFNKLASAKFQSIKDLYDRKVRIKNAILDSNSKTTVKVGDESMTVTDAITKKSLIDSYEDFINNMKSKRNDTMKIINLNNEKIEQNAIRLAEAALQKDNVSIGDDDASSIISPYVEKNKFHLVDPLNIDKFIEEKEQYILDFKSNVDAVLSESNAITFIEL